MHAPLYARMVVECVGSGWAAPGGCGSGSGALSLGCSSHLVGTAPSNTHAPLIEHSHARKPMSTHQSLTQVHKHTHNAHTGSQTNEHTPAHSTPSRRRLQRHLVRAAVLSFAAAAEAGKGRTLHAPPAQHGGPVRGQCHLHDGAAGAVPLHFLGAGSARWVGAILLLQLGKTPVVDGVVVVVLRTVPEFAGKLDRSVDSYHFGTQAHSLPSAWHL